MDLNGVVPLFLKKDKPIYVFSSHFHEDHFNSAIFEWRKLHDKITYILSKDIYKHRRAKSEDADRIRGLKAGADAYLVKPFIANELLVRVEKLLLLRQQLRERFSQAILQHEEQPKEELNPIDQHQRCGIGKRGDTANDDFRIILPRLTGCLERCNTGQFTANGTCDIGNATLDKRLALYLGNSTHHAFLALGTITHHHNFLQQFSIILECDRNGCAASNGNSLCTETDAGNHQDTVSGYGK